MKKKTALILSVGVFVLAAVVFVVLRFMGFGRGSGSIVLPQNTSHTSDTEDVAQKNLRDMEEITVTKENVREVVKTLSRPSEYDMIARLDYYNENGDASFTSRLRAKNGVYRITVCKENGDVVKNLILTAANVYIWGNESQSFFQGKRGDATEDDEARLPTYEDICALKDEEITDAGTAEIDGVLCVYAAAKKEGADADEKYYVSVLNGLLYAYEAEHGGEKYVSVKTLSADLSPVQDSWFMLPSGALAE